MKLNKEDALRWLEQAEHNLPTRYPDALARPAVPFKTYTENDAKEAIKIVKEIVKKVKEKIRGGKK